MEDFFKTLPNQEQFSYRECSFAGDLCWLINPKKTDDDIWTPNNLGFRSVVVRQSDGFVINRGQNKFFNVGQSSDLYPDPSLFDDLVYSEKLDGSLLCVSKYKNIHIVRTRGSTDVDVHESGPESKSLINEVVGLWSHDLISTHSFLFENTTPSNRIILKYEKPAITLLDIIKNQSGEYLNQKEVDEIALQLQLARPKVFKFDSIADVLENCKTLKDLEGYVINYNNGQNKLKAKGLFYLKMHRAKSLVGSTRALFEIWIEYGCPDYLEFYEKLGSNLDFEISEMSKDEAKIICAAKIKATRKIEEVKEFVSLLQNKSRAEQAKEIINKDRDNSGLYFAALDKKIDSAEQLAKLCKKYLNL